MGKKEEYDEENGCEGWGKGFKPYKVRYRIITEGVETVCLSEKEDDIDYLIDSLSMRAWDLGDFDVIILGKEEAESIDDS